MSTTAIKSNRLYGGAPTRLERWMGLVKPDDLRVKIRAMLMIVSGWVPLVLLAAALLHCAFYRFRAGVETLARERGIRIRQFGKKDWKPARS
jgi:hypothetical protein